MYNYTDNIQQQSIQEIRNDINDEKIYLENFVLSVQDEISSSCNIPIKIPDKNLLNIIDKCKKWFYEHYEESVESAYLYISNKIFESNNYLIDKTILLPKDVFSVYGIHKPNSSFPLQYIEFIENSNFYNIYNNVDNDLIGYVANSYYNTMRNATLLNLSMKYSYNRLTNKLKIMGETPFNGLVLEVYRTIPDKNLFDNELFFRYVVAKARKNIAMILGVFTYNLPGNIQINFDLIQSMGQEEIDKIEEEIKTDEGVDYFFEQNS